MGKLFKFLQYIFLPTLILTIFNQWFKWDMLTGGDFWYSYPSNYNQYNIIWYAWSWVKGNGLGINSTLYQEINFVIGLPLFIFGHILHFPFVVVSKIAFFYPFLILSVFSSYYLHKKIFKKTTFWIISSLIFLFNTYILTLTSGGQIILGLSYALTPIVLYLFIDGISNKKENTSILLTGIFFGLQALIDLRYAYVLLVGVFLYYFVYIASIFRFKDLGYYLKILCLKILLPIIIGLLLNGFWSVPLLLNRKNPLSELGDAYSSLGSVKFFSFATFENTISLLHPNWPENLFGKVYFMRPEFLFIPVLAFMSLFAVRKIKDIDEKRNIIFFTLLGLLGAFLSKGAQEPFGIFYLFLFSHVPGMEMFRDPTKFYTLTAVSYSILIPYVFYKLIKKIKFKKTIFLMAIFICFWLFTVRQAIFQELSGTFKTHPLPGEYIKLEKILHEDKTFGRALWVPQIQRFGYYSQVHPPITANDFLKTYSYSDLFKKMNTNTTKELLEESAVEYVIVPYDSVGEIFLEDRKYSQRLYKKTLDEMKKIPYLKQDERFTELGVFKNYSFKDHFWVNSKNASVSFVQVSPVEFNVTLKNIRRGDLLIFSETFDSGWKGIINGQQISSIKYHNKFNSFVLPSGDNGITISYTPQKFVNIGVAISLLTILSIFGYYLRKFFYVNK